MFARVAWMRPINVRVMDGQRIKQLHAQNYCHGQTYAGNSW